MRQPSGGPSIQFWSVTYAYDAAGPLQTVTEASGRSLTFAHDSDGNITSLAGVLLTTNAYDDASRLTTITRGSNVFAFGYDDANRRTSLAYPNSIATSYAYDDASRLTSLAAALGGTTITSACTATPMASAAGSR